MERWENLLDKAREALTEAEALREAKERGDFEEDFEEDESIYGKISKLIFRARALSGTALHLCEVSPGVASVKCLESASNVIASINYAEKEHHKKTMALLHRAVRECRRGDE